MKIFLFILVVNILWGGLSAQQTPQFRMDSLSLSDSSQSFYLENLKFLTVDTLLNKDLLDLRQLPKFDFNQDNIPIYVPRGNWKKRIFKIDSVDRFSMIIKEP